MIGLGPGCVKIIFGDRDEILGHEFGLRRNNESPRLSSGFKYCAEGLGIRVFTQPGSKAAIATTLRQGPPPGAEQT